MWCLHFMLFNLVLIFANLWLSTLFHLKCEASTGYYDELVLLLLTCLEECESPWSEGDNFKE